MEANNKNTIKFEDNEESGFDFIGWIMLFVQHWYLFVLFVIIGYGAAYLKNKTWIPNYQTLGTFMIEESGSRASQNFMRGFSVQNGYSNLDNQTILLRSYDLMGRVVDSLPQMGIDYLSVGKFKTVNLYNNSPIKINTEYIDPRVYGVLFKITLEEDGSFVIHDEEEVLNKNLKIKGRIGIPLKHSLFFITIDKVSEYTPNEKLYFRFRTKQSLVNDFYTRLDPKFLGESSIVGVSLVSQTPNRDIDFINKLFHVFLAENLKQKNNEATKTIDFVNERLNKIKKTLKVSENQIKEFRTENNIVDISNHTNGILEKATQYDEVNSQLSRKREYLTYLENYLNTNIEKGNIIAPAYLGVSEPMLVELVTQFNQSIAKLNETSKRNPTYKLQLREIENIKKTINEVMKSIHTSIKIEQRNLDKKMKVLRNEINLLPVQESRMIDLERKYKIDESYYNFFINKKVEAQVQKAANSPDNKVVDKARIIGVTNIGEKRQVTFSYILIALLIPAGILIIRELLNNTIQGPKDIEKATIYPLIGTIKHTKSNDPLLVSKYPRSVFTEMFRVIRTRIEFITQRKSNITLLSTSTESGDGKTYVNINLATVYAMTGKKTLLIDLDIRKPSIGNRLGIEQKDGVTNYLIGERTLDEIIIKKDEFKFDLLLGGTVPPNPGEVIRSNKLKEMIETLKGMYDYIIVDTSPLGLVADAYSLIPLMDVNLFIVRNEKTNKTFFKRITEQIKSDNLQNVYIVLNDVDIEANKYTSYGRKYGYGYGYGYGKNKKDNEYASYYKDEEDDL